jgi:glycerol-3-phosphate acyltransferase PlsY
MIYAFLAVPLGYLLGSIPSAYIVGRLGRNIDVRSAGDGRIGAAAIYKKIGLAPYLLVIVMDVGKAIIAVLAAKLLTDFLIPSQPTIALVIELLTGFAVVTGHNWSAFMKLKGGLGATATFGVLAALGIFQFLIAGALTLIPLLTTRKSGLSTGFLVIVLAVVFLIQKLFFEPQTPIILIVYPILIIMFMLLKRYQIRKAVSESP